jgi:hypothetical protein
MERRIFHGKIKPLDVANALLGEFNQGNFRAQTLGQKDRVVVQVSTRPDAMSGGQTAMTVTVQTVDEGIMIELGEQAWLGVAASLGVSALSALKNPFSLLGRLDDIAQDIENLSIRERAWRVISKAARAAGASAELSENLRRTTCEYCHVANEVGAPSCVACGAPMGLVQPDTCKNCGYVVKVGMTTCPNCKQGL